MNKSMQNNSSNSIIKSLFFILYFLFFMLFTACQFRKELPILGEKAYDTRTVNGKEIIDTVYFSLPNFSFIDQDSQRVTPKTFENKIYIADFFFTSCPTICPTMKTQMLRVYQEYEDNKTVAFLSHSIDPTYDTVALLKDYSERLGVKTEKWHFVTGNQDEIFEVAQKGYLVPAQEDKEDPSGLLHSGAFILIDKNKRIRGYYDGTDPKKVDLLIEDIGWLLKEYEAN